VKARPFSKAFFMQLSFWLRKIPPASMIVFAVHFGNAIGFSGYRTLA